MHLFWSFLFFLSFDFQARSLVTLRIHWRLPTILRARNKSVWSNVFWYLKVCIFWKFNIKYPIHGDKIPILRKFPSDTINVTKNVLFFLSGAPTRHSFTFHLRFLYERKHKACLSKILFGIFHFRFWFVFIKAFIFV